MSGEKQAEAELIQRLEAMNGAIRHGSFEELGAFSGELETILIDLHRLDRAALNRVRKGLERNIACLDAAAQGLRAGRRRLAEIVAAGRSDTYGRGGQRQTLSMTGPGRRV